MRLLEALISALMVAGLYATMSYGLALIYGVMKIINLANAGSMMLGSFLTFFLWQTFGIDPLVCVLIVAPVFFFVGALIETVFVRRVTNEKPVISLLLLFGILLVMQGGASFFLGGEVRSVRPAYIKEVIHLGEVTIAWNRLLVFVAGAAILVALELFMRRTYLGRAIRALAQDVPLAPIPSSGTARSMRALSRELGASRSPLQLLRNTLEWRGGGALTIAPTRFAPTTR